jgi:hypothetical protein
MSLSRMIMIFLASTGMAESREARTSSRLNHVHRHRRRECRKDKQRISDADVSNFAVLTHILGTSRISRKRDEQGHDYDINSLETHLPLTHSMQVRSTR